MKPFEALEAVIQWFFLSSRSFENKPGAVIKRLPQSIKEPLSDLKSEDINEVSKRKDYWQIYAGTDDSYEELKRKQALTDFDKKILK